MEPEERDRDPYHLGTLERLVRSPSGDASNQDGKVVDVVANESGNVRSYRARWASTDDPDRAIEDGWSYVSDVDL